MREHHDPPHPDGLSSPPDGQAGSWTLLTAHAHVLVEIARNPHARIRDLAAKARITERTAQAIVTDLEQAGCITRNRTGRRTRYTINPDSPFRHPPARPPDRPLPGPAGHPSQGTPQPARSAPRPAHTTTQPAPPSSAPPEPLTSRNQPEKPFPSLKRKDFVAETTTILHDHGNLDGAVHEGPGGTAH